MTSMIDVGSTWNKYMSILNLYFNARQMRKIFVVYDKNDMPFEEFNSLEDAYWWAMSCWDNYWYPVYIDMFEWHSRADIRWFCENNDLWYNKDGEWRGLDCAEEDWIKWHWIVRAKTKEDLQLYDIICLTCNLSFKRHPNDNRQI